jgi:hypothetical protein
MLWIIQLGLPLCLLIALALWRPQNTMLRWGQVIATGFVILALQLAGLWMMPPWWTPWLLWALFGVAIWRRRVGANLSLSSVFARVFFGLCWLGLAGLSGWAIIEALNARMLPGGPVANLSSPLMAGHYYVANGGSREMVNAHLHTLGRATPCQRNYWGQSYGVDIIVTDAWGIPVSTAALALSADTIGAVLAPCSGRVVRAQNDRPNAGPIDRASSTARAGNYVLLRCGEFDVLLAHLQRDSVRVQTNAIVSAGQIIGTIGSSGESDMPHLHVHAQQPGSGSAPFSGQPVAIRIGGRALVRGDRL